LQSRQPFFSDQRKKMAAAPIRGKMKPLLPGNSLNENAQTD
jgi:hypothetical protein